MDNRNKENKNAILDTKVKLKKIATDKIIMIKEK